MNDMPICPFGARKCFAFDFSTKCCKALENTKFRPRRGCMFNKTKEQYLKENPDKKERENDERDSLEENI